MDDEMNVQTQNTGRDGASFSLLILLDKRVDKREVYKITIDI